ncbi:MAG: DUF1501 domain-containing protein [Planctomycetes bacterium]|nr:DUF1501 domain-containing protein [Planctomycetota bacterium]
MLTILGHPSAACDGLTRRALLKAGSLSLLGGILGPRVHAATGPEPSASPGRVRSVVLLDLFGGPSHIDTFDPKPDAPAEIRGEFASIATSLPGVRVTEHLPRLSRWLNRTCLIRTLSHPYNSHNPYAVMTGYTGGQDQRDYFSSPTNHPSMGSVCHYTGLTRPGVPPYVVLPAHPGYSDGLRRAGPYGGYLGGQYNPLFALADPTVGRPTNATTDFYDHTLRPMGEPHLPSMEAAVTLDALDRRRTLLDQINQAAARLDSSRPVSLMGARQRQAFDLLQSSSARSAFDLALEPVAVKERYGRDIFGSSVLLARRLVEAGVTFIAVHTEAKPNGHWDTHENNFNMLRHWLLPFLDRALSALFDDLWQRGLWDQTLIVVMGDMGRTPRINARAGRDHWPQCGFCLLAGGGIRTGHVHGRSDRGGGYPLEFPVTPGDICATIYHLIGVDPELTVPDQTGRPVHISQGGSPIRGVLA